MLKCYKSISLVLALMTASLFANIGPNCLEECCDANGYNWRLDAEFLYFLPSFDDTYFVIQSGASAAGTPRGNRINNDFNFKPGFRVGAAFAFCGCNSGELQLYYSRINATESKTVSDGFLWATVGSADFAAQFENYLGSASSRLSFLYQRVDAFYSHPLCCDNCFKINTLFGLEYAYIRFDEQYQFRVTGGNRGDVGEIARTKGIGTQFGFNLNYLVCPSFCCASGNLSVVGNAFGSLLASKSELAATDIVNGAILLDLTDVRTWRMIPAFHTRIGLNYATCFSCWQGALEIGYEFSSYLRALSRYSSPDDVAEGLTFTQYYNFDIQGLYVAFSAAF